MLHSQIVAWVTTVAKLGEPPKVVRAEQIRHNFAYSTRHGKRVSAYWARAGTAVSVSLFHPTE